MGGKRPSLNQDIPPSLPQAGSTPHVYGGHPDHSFTLQSIMEMQKSLGSLESSINTMASNMDKLTDSVSDLKKKVGNVEKVMYAAGVVLVCAIAIGGWVLNTVKEFAMTAYKANIEASIRQHAPVSPSSAPPQPK